MGFQDQAANIQAQRVIDAQKEHAFQDEIQELKQSLSYMKQREFDREVRERLNEERKKRVKARVRHKKNRLEMLLPLQIFIAQSKSLRQVNTAVAEARHVCVLLFLFVTGMRIANCLDLQSKH